MAQVILRCWVFFETIKTLGVYLPDKAPIFLRPFFPSIHLFGRVKPACNELGIFELLWFKMRGVCSGARVNNNMTDRAFNVVRCFWKYNFKFLQLIIVCPFFMDYFMNTVIVFKAV